ncbi:MAG: hypothetical protein WCD86_25315, partial [Ktedonobacteraceae bacterium]
MGSALRDMGPAAEAGAKQAESAFKRLSLSANSLYRSLTTVLGAFTLMGVSSAQSVKRLNASFQLLAGSSKAANEYMAQLQELAKETNQPLLDLQRSATAFLPAVRQNNLELGKTVLLAQRLLLKDPTAFAYDATRAMSELFEGTTRSIEARFGVYSQELKSAVAAKDFQGAVVALDDYLNKLGITEDALQAMGAEGVNSFAVLRDEGTQTLAVFFEPFLNDVLIPITRAFGNFLRELRKLNPELQKFIGISAGLAGMGALSQNIPMLGRIPGGATIGKAGVYGAALYGGAQGGATIARAAGAPGTEGKSNSEILGNAWTTFKQALLGAFSTLLTIGKTFEVGELVIRNSFDVVEASIKLGGATIGNAFADVVDTLAGAVAAIAQWEGDFLLKMSSIDLGEFSIGSGALKQTFDLGTIDLGTGDAGQALTDYAEGVRTTGDALRTSDQTMQDYLDTIQYGIYLTDEQQASVDKMNQDTDQLIVSFGKTLGLFEEAPSAFDVLNGVLLRLKETMIGVADAARAENAPPITITDDLLAGFQQYQDDLAQLDAEAQQASLDETRDYEERKAEIIRRFAESVQQMLEDEAIRYARALSDTQRREREIRASLQEQLTEASRELGESIKELNEQYYKEQRQATKDHLRALREIQEDGRESILSAAMRLDAMGIFEATRATQQRLEDEKERYQEEQVERRVKLSEAIADERQAYAERVQLAKQHAQEQITALWDQFNREEQLRREDN